MLFLSFIMVLIALLDNRSLPYLLEKVSLAALVINSWTFQCDAYSRAEPMKMSLKHYFFFLKEERKK